MAKKQRKWPMVMACSVAGLWAVGSATGSTSSASGAAATRPEAQTSPKPAVTGIKAKIRYCESTDRYTVVNPAGPAYGAYQFMDPLWHEVMDNKYRHASDAPAAVQDEAFDTAYAKYGTKPWFASKPCWSKR